MDREPLLTTHDLHKAFGGQKVLAGVSASIATGDVVLLRGANGSGKTTLLNILSGALEADAGTVQFSDGARGRTFSFPLSFGVKAGVAFTPEAFARRGVGRTWQDMRLSHSQTLRQNIAVAYRDQIGERPLQLLNAFAARAIRRQEQQIQATASQRLAELGLGERTESLASKVSLGQGKRVAILRAVEAGARVLLLDEPLAGLDDPGVREVLALLRRLSEERQTALVIVEHVFHVPRILKFASRVWTLRDGRLFDETADVARHAAAPAADLPRFIAGTAQATGVDTYSLPRGARLYMIRSGGNGAREVLAVRDMAVYRGNRLVVGAHNSADGITGLSFEIAEGEIGLLQAPNGWGKTTVLDAIAGVVQIGQGDVVLDGIPVGSEPAWKRVAAGVGYQRARDNSFPNLTVKETLQLCGAPLASRLASIAGRRMSSLSGGERQRVVVAAAAASARRLLLLDEPFASLDDEGTEKTWSIIRRTSQRATLIAIPINEQGETS
jgi:branched-chain amino acid transport system ATP-binding protein